MKSLFLDLVIFGAGFLIGFLIGMDPYRDDDGNDMGGAA